MYAVLVGDRSGKFGVVVLKASMLDWGVHLPGTSAKFGVTAFKASDICQYTAKFGVAVFKTCILDWWGVHLASLV